MSTGNDRFRNPVRAALAVLGILALVLLAAGSSASIGEDLSTRPSALTPEFAFVANRTVAGRGDPIRFTATLTLSGSGSNPQTWLNLSFDPRIVPDLANATAPPGCARVAPPIGVDGAWECDGLRAGAHAWVVTGAVGAGADPLGTAIVVAGGATVGGGTTWGLGPETVTVALSAIRFLVTSDFNPGASVLSRERVFLSVKANNSSLGCEGDEANCTARNVVLRVVVADWLFLDPGTPRVRYANASALTNGSHVAVEFNAVVPSDATIGSADALRAYLTYDDPDGRPIAYPPYAVSLTVRAPSTFDLIAVAVLTGAFAVLLTVGGLLFAGQRGLRIEEVFLMHRNGVLLEHKSRSTSLRKDEELVASMLVAIQDFVRDSFRTEGTLDELRFTGRRAAIVRGKRVILAGIISRGDVTYLVPQLRGAVADLERVHGKALEDWDGRMSRLEQAGGIIDRLMAGGYRAGRGWIGDARARIRGAR